MTDKIENTKLLVCISFLFRLDKLKYLFQIINDLYEIDCFSVVVVIFTEEDNAENLLVLNRLTSKFERNKFRFEIVSRPDLKGALRALPWAHKAYIKEKFQDPDCDFSHFVYLEEDIRFSRVNFKYFLDYRGQLKQSGLIPGFIRIEFNEALGDIFTADQRSVNNFAGRSKLTIGDLDFLNLDEPYAAMHLMDRELLSEYIGSPSFDFEKSYDVVGWGEPERAAMGLAFENVPDGFIFRTVVPVSRRTRIPDVMALVHHLPNNYTNNYTLDANYPLGKIRLDEIFGPFEDNSAPEISNAVDGLGLDRVDIETLTSEGQMSEALIIWQTRVTLKASQSVKPGGGLTVIPDQPQYSYWHSNHEKTEIVPAIGCDFLENISVFGKGYLFHKGEFLSQPSYLSNIAYEEVRSGGPQIDLARNQLREIEHPSVIVFGPGWQVYGHWLLDFLPRIFIARETLGASFSDFKILLPRNLPRFVETMLSYFLRLPDEQFSYFDAASERLILRRACIPTYAHRNYTLHPFIRETYRTFLPKPPIQPFRRICLSRRKIERQTLSAVRFFEQREAFEAMAVERGFQLIVPEDLPLAEQITLMVETEVQIGEHGSAQHASIFSAPGTVVGTIHPMNNVQMQIGRLCSQHNVIVMADSETKDPDGIIRFSVSHENLVKFFDAVERAAKFRFRPVG